MPASSESIECMTHNRLTKTTINFPVVTYERLSICNHEKFQFRHQINVEISRHKKRKRKTMRLWSAHSTH
uniref:Uncharacterized protein n=1 Tax=Arundo donax TaxID=35708 RepID=A0A0A9ABB6_ARUDO